METKRTSADFYLSQAAALALALLLLAVQGRSPLELLAVPKTAEWAVWAFAAAVSATALNAVLAKRAPDAFADDPAARLFGEWPPWHAAWASAVSAVCEELLFRGAVQYWIGPFGAAVVFAVAHPRYLRHGPSAAAVFAIGLALGWAYVRTGTLWCPIAAHGAVNFAAYWILRRRSRNCGRRRFGGN